MRAAARQKIRAGLVLGGAALILSAGACSGWTDGSDSTLCENEVKDYYSPQRLREETDYRDSQIRDMVDDPELKSNRWAECMSGMGWICTSLAPIECTIENKGTASSPFE
jgi:hypothetical protein